MATITQYVDLSDNEEKKAKELIGICKEIIDIVESIKPDHQDAADLSTKLGTLSTKIMSLRPYVGQINNLKSTIDSAL